LIFVLSWSTKISSTRLATLLTIKGCTGYHIRRRIARYHIRYPGGCIKYCCRFRPSFQVRNDAILFKKYKYLSNIYLKWSWGSWQYFTWNDRGEAGNILLEMIVEKLAIFYLKWSWGSWQYFSRFFMLACKCEKMWNWNILS
jgi:hypothetical protein